MWVTHLYLAAGQNLRQSIVLRGALVEGNSRSRTATAIISQMKKSSRKLPRFSLLGLLLLMSIIALSLALWTETSRRLPLQREIDSLRREVGEVKVADPSMLYVQPLGKPFDSRLQFRWRVYVPSGHKGEVIVYIEQSDRKRAGHLTLALESGETSVELVVVPPFKGQGTAWMYRLGQSASNRAGGRSGPRPPWLDSEAIEEGLAFDDYDPTQGITSGSETILMDQSGQSAEQSSRVLVKVKHYSQGKSPGSAASAGHTKLLPSRPQESILGEAESR